MLHKRLEFTNSSRADFVPGTNPERFLACCVILHRDNCEGATMLVRQIRMISQDVSADVRLCLTVASLYTIVGLGLVVAFM
jgi:hypothetical protein